MSALTDLTIEAMLDGLKAKDFTSLELVEAHIAAAEAAKGLNAFIVDTHEHARDRAREADARYAAGSPLSVDGLPIGVKDLFCTEGVRSTACSDILGEFTPTYESTVSGNLKRDGAIMIGKLNMDEFAMGSSNETSVYGDVVNPWRRGNDDTPLGTPLNGAVVVLEVDTGEVLAMVSTPAPPVREIGKPYPDLTLDPEPSRRRGAAEPTRRGRRKV